MAEPIFVKTLKLRAEHVDFRRKMRPSVLMRLFQECCIAHTEELGMGRKMTLDRGFLWVVTSERIQIDRMPEYDEEITLECYPGPMLHYFFPRNLVVKDAQGSILVKGNAMWALIDEKSRAMIDPKEHGIHVEGQDLPGQIAPAMMIPTPVLSLVAKTEASYSLVDINGHLNNCSYLDIAMDLFDKEDLSRDMSEIALVFKKEIPLGESFDINYGKEKEAYYFASKDRFALKISLR